MIIYLIVVCAVIYGSILSSFVTLVGYRVPIGMSVVNPSSHCSSCKNELAPIDLIPVLSYVINRGKCRKCGVAYGSFHVWLEVAVALLFGIIAYTFYGNWIVMVGYMLYVLYVNTMIVSLRVHRIGIDKLTVTVGIYLVVLSIIHSSFLFPLFFVVIGFLLFPRVRLVYFMQYISILVMLIYFASQIMWGF